MQSTDVTFPNCVWAKLRPYRRTFLILWIYALLIHLPLLVLRLTNDLDGLWNQDDYMAGAWELSIGRWFWPFLDKARFGISLDPLPAVFSLALYVLSFLLILRLLDLAPFALTILCGCLFLGSVGIVCQMSFGYMAVTFAVSFFLAVLAVWVLLVPVGKYSDSSTQCAASFSSSLCIKKGGVRSSSLSILRILLSSVCIALMMGCYQAGIGTTALVSLFVLLYSFAAPQRASEKTSDSPDGREGSFPPKAAGASPEGDSSCGRSAGIHPGNAFLPSDSASRIRFIMRIFLSVLFGGILYVLLLRLRLWQTGTQASDYQGFSSISPRYILAGIPGALCHCYQTALGYFVNGTFLSNALERHLWFPVFYLPVLLVCLLVFIRIFRKNRAEAFLFLIVLFLIPAAANCFYLAAPETETHMQMVVSMGLILPLLLGFAGDLTPAGCAFSKASSNIRKLPTILLVLDAVILIYGNILQCEMDQYAMYAGRRATRTLAESILTEANRQGYDYIDGQLLITGAPASSKTFYTAPLFEKANAYAQYGRWSSDVSFSRVSWTKFYSNYLRINVSFAAGDTEATIASLPEVAAMPSYPAAGSVQNIYGVLVVKLGGAEAVQ